MAVYTCPPCGLVFSQIQTNLEPLISYCIYANTSPRQTRPRATHAQAQDQAQAQAQAQTHVELHTDRRPHVRLKPQLTEA